MVPELALFNIFKQKASVFGIQHKRFSPNAQTFQAQTEPNVILQQVYLFIFAEIEFFTVFLYIFRHFPGVAAVIFQKTDFMIPKQDTVTLRTR